MTTSLIWFGNNLRVHDNEALHLAAKTDRLIALYCFDPRQFLTDKFGFKKTERFRAKFLLETVQQLHENLKALNITLYVYQEKPEDVIPDLVRQFNIDAVFVQNEWTSEEKQTVQNV